MARLSCPSFSSSTSPLLLLPAFLLVILFLFVSTPTTENHLLQFFSTSNPLIEDILDPSRNLTNLSPLDSPSTTSYISSVRNSISNTNTSRDTISYTSISKDVNSSSREKTSMEKVEADLAIARAAIRKAIKTRKYTLDNNEYFIPRGSIYRNPYAFHQSHKEMVKRFKVWSYREGQPPLIHDGRVHGKYAIGGQIMNELESETSSFKASHPDEAHAFFLPFSVANVVRYVYMPIINQTDFRRDRLQRIVADYILVVANKHPFWNRSNGADHFMVSCHDWAPDISNVYPELYKNFILVLCNANVTEGFRPNRDVSLPEVYIPKRGKLGPPILGQDPDKRSILAFFSGKANGDIRKILLHHWKDKDDGVQVYQYLPKGQNYNMKMSQSKFCLCPSGFEVASPRIVEAIYAGCVPVIISSNYSLPFSDVLDWSQFSIEISIEKIPEIKNILQAITSDEYLKMYNNVMKVQRHFVLSRPANPYDVIHMVLHSVWLRRLDIKLKL